MFLLSLNESLRVRGFESQTFLVNLGALKLFKMHRINSGSQLHPKLSPDTKKSQKRKIFPFPLGNTVLLYTSLVFNKVMFKGSIVSNLMTDFESFLKTLAAKDHL